MEIEINGSMKDRQGDKNEVMTEVMLNLLIVAKKLPSVPATVINPHSFTVNRGS